MATLAADPTAKRPGPGLALSIGAIILGTILGITGLAVGVSKVVHNLVAYEAISPAQLDKNLSAGTWQIYVAGDVALSPQQVQVRAANGAQIPTTAMPNGLSESQTRGGLGYVAEVRFTITTPGTYTVKVNGARGTPILLSKSFGDLAKHAVGWFVLMGIGMLIGLIGVILLIVGIVRRRRFARGPAPAYAGGYGQPMGGIPPGGAYPPAYPPAYQPQGPRALPAPGWYADPSLPGTQRWWDGTRWTDQTQTPT
jgi:Protein of unknown function (DUF2510)